MVCILSLKTIRGTVLGALPRETVICMGDLFTLHLKFQQPPQLFWSNEHRKHERVGPLQLILNLHGHLTTPWYSIAFPPLRSPPNLPLVGNFTLHLHHHHS